MGNDPVNKTDPSGMCGFLTPICIWLGLGGGAATTTGAAVTTVAATTTTVTTTELAVGVAVGTVIAATAIAVKNEASNSVDELINTTTPGDATKGRTRNHTKPGTIDTANDDFDEIVDPDTVKDRGNGVRTGKTRDGRNVNVRPRSSDGRPTLEIQGKKYKDKIRYNEPPKEQFKVGQE